ncbi:unnamed protein product, partial [Musa banksii]
MCTGHWIPPPLALRSPSQWTFWSARWAAQGLLSLRGILRLVECLTLKQLACQRARVIESSAGALIVLGFGIGF